jgi:four helix bundle protein
MQAKGTRSSGASRKMKATTREKLQAPSTKLQRSSKIQAPKERNGGPTGTRYSKREVTAARAAENGNGAPRHPFDLEERTATFGEAIIRFAKTVPRSPANDRLVGQVVGCGTSIGANYCEANERVPKKDFRKTIGRCVKEAKETKYFLRLIAAAEPSLADEARALYREAKDCTNLCQHVSPMNVAPCLKFGAWSFPGAWCLELGAFPR